jgi:hypothetical protein
MHYSVPGAFTSFHSDGTIQEIIPDLLDMGWDEINPQVWLVDIEQFGCSGGG